VTVTAGARAGARSLLSWSRGRRRPGDPGPASESQLSLSDLRTRIVSEVTVTDQSGVT
jgi:hypothetical protein